MTAGRQLSLLETGLETGGPDRLPSAGCSARAEFRCDGCGAVEARTFSCVRPCRSCPWRRGRITPLVRRLPAVPIRHWVLTLPSPWRDTLVQNAVALRKFRLAATCEILSAFERHGRRELGTNFARAGAAVVLHPASGDLSVNVHFHLLVLDGVYVPCAGPRGRRFVAHEHPLSRSALEDIARRIRKALDRLAPPSDGPLPMPSPRPLRRSSPAGNRKPSPHPTPPAPDSAVEADGVCLHRSPRISATDRQSLARVAGYVTRPLIHPSAIDRVQPSMISLRLHRPGRDGATRLQFSNQEFERRLNRLTLPGVAQAVTYHGALAAGGADGYGHAAQQLELELELLSRGNRVPARPRRGRRCGACGERMHAVALERID